MKRLRLWFALLAVALAALSVGAQTRMKVAVIDAILPSGIAKAAVGPITEAVIEQLVSSGKYDILDRSHTGKILEETEFQLSGLVDDASAVKAGSLLGADAVVIIKVDALEGIFFISVKLIEVKTARILAQASDSRETPKVASLVEMAGIAAKRLAGSSTVLAASQEEVSPRITLVTGVEGPKDPYVGSVWEGLRRFTEGKGLSADKCLRLAVPASAENMRKEVYAAAEAKPDLVLCVGFMFELIVAEAAKAYPDVKFGLVDGTVREANVRCALFSEKDGAFLAGVAAGLKAKADGKKSVGFIGGVDFPLIRVFQAGFVQGVKAVYPGCKVTEAWVGSFTDPEGGRKAAKKLYDEGAYIIFHAAGLAGNGVFEEAIARAKKRDTRWVIGVDIDQYGIGLWEPGKSVTLTSFVKRTDAAANFLARTSDIQNEIWGGVFVLGVNEGGVGLPRENPNLTADIAKAIAEFEKKIYDGLIVVKDKL